MSNTNANANTYAANLTNHNPTVYSTNASFVYSAKYTQAVLGLLDPQVGDRIVDLGCGTGELTRGIASSVGPTGVVVGVDSSQSMLDKASSANPTDGQGIQIEYHKADIQHAFKPGYLPEELKYSFDKVFTSATLHWCKADPGGVLETVKWLLKPGGLFVYEFGGYGNAVGVRSALHQVLKKRGIDPIPLDPWYYPTDRQYEALLGQHSLQPIDTGLFPRPTPVPTGLRGWLATFAKNTFLTGLDEDTSEEIMSEVEDICRVDMYWNMSHPGMGVSEAGTAKGGGEGEEGWEVMYVRLRGKATWPGN